MILKKKSPFYTIYTFNLKLFQHGTTQIFVTDGLCALTDTEALKSGPAMMWKRTVVGVNSTSESSHSCLLVLCFFTSSPPPHPSPSSLSLECWVRRRVSPDSLFSFLLSPDISGPVKPVTEQYCLGTGLVFLGCFFHIYEGKLILGDHAYGEKKIHNITITAFFEHYMLSSAKIPISDWNWSC